MTTAYYFSEFLEPEQKNRNTERRLRLRLNTTGDVKKMGKASRINIEGLSSHPPWTVLSTKSLASALGIDSIALAMRVYRGVGPKPGPATWIRGHIRAYTVSNVLRWLGDTRSSTNMFRDSLIQNDLTDLTANDLLDDDAVRLYTYVAVEVNPNAAIVGAKFTPKGWKEYLRSIRDETGL
jgi:hypothetical protein